MSAPITDIKKLYDYTLQQMAAESYLENRFAWGNRDDVIDVLTKGTNRAGYQNGDPNLNQGWPGYTRMTQSQAEEFWDNFKIIHQWSDDPTPTGYRPGAQGNPAFAQLNDEILANTGFSATLIKSREAQGLTPEYTLSIRSTESRNWDSGGDSERDMSPTDIFGVALSGFALAQLDAMEQYYQRNKGVGVNLPRFNGHPEGGYRNPEGVHHDYWQISAVYPRVQDRSRSLGG